MNLLSGRAVAIRLTGTLPGSPLGYALSSTSYVTPAAKTTSWTIDAWCPDLSFRFQGYGRTIQVCVRCYGWALQTHNQVVATVATL